MHPNSRLLFKKYASSLIRDGARVLEIGPDDFPSTYQQIVGDRKTQWETLELSHRPGITHVASSEYKFPIEDNTYDVVISGQVIEHVRKIWVWMNEVARICKPGGLVITINPVSWPFHENPVDCWRIYPDGMRALYEDAGLTVQTSVFESLEPYKVTTLDVLERLLKAVKGGWVPPFKRQEIDTITIGTKGA